MKKEIEIRKKGVGHVVVIAPPSFGKSVLLGKLKTVLEECGAVVIEERHEQEPLESKHKDWEVEMMKNTVWILREEV